jgi:hypothetical protein
MKSERNNNFFKLNKNFFSRYRISVADPSPHHSAASGFAVKLKDPDLRFSLSENIIKISVYTKQYFGSGMIIPDLIFFHPGSKG